MEESYEIIASASQDSRPAKKRIRKLEEKWTSAETEKLIEHVQLREGTWNILTTTYKDRNLREALWKEIAGEMKMAPSEIKNKWNSLRCSFRTTLNKMNSTKSGQGASTKQPPQIFHLLKFLEPTLRLEAPTISNLSEDLGTLDTIDENENTQTPTIVAKRRRNDDSSYIKVVERALETMEEASKSDIWDDIGSFVTANGREWHTKFPALAVEFKTEVYKLVLRFQEKETEAEIQFL